MMEAGPIYRSAIDGRVHEGTDIIALIAVPDKPDMGRQIFVSQTAMI